MSSKMVRKRICVIGGGPMGVGAIKSLKEEDLDPVCFERTGHMGGLWRYHQDDVDGLASVMKTTIINSSKELTALSDFPPREDAPNYMHNRLVYQYIEDYARAFGLEQHIRFNMDVVSVDLADDYDDTGCLKVSVRNTKTQEVSEDVFDGVVVCVGHHVYPNMPTFPGMEKFKGTTMHTHSLKKVEPFDDKVVVVVGVGNSGMDAAVEISSVAKQVYLSTRKGAWVLPRLGPYGFPLDVALTRRWLDMLFHYLPYNWVCWFSESSLNRRFDHSLYNLKPKHRIWSQHATISDGLPIKLLSGMVQVRKNIKEFVENGVIFENDAFVTECDAVVFATGYQIKFPFLSDKLTTIKDNEVHLYKYVFPPHLKHPSLVVGGLIQSVGGGFPLGEAQMRWATLVLKGKLSLPSREEMELDIQKKREMNRKRYVDSKRHTIQVDYIEYIDEICDLFGAKPNFLKMFFLDPVLFWTLMFGPSLPYQYRLQGPHAWPQARKTIMEWGKRVATPLKKDYKENFRPKSTLQNLSLLVLLLGLVFYLTMYP